MNIIELFNTGGISLVLIAGFLSALIWIIKYFVRQIDTANEERKILNNQFIEERKTMNDSFREERKEMVGKFDLMLSNHCKMVADALDKQEIVFHRLVEILEIRNQ